MEWNEYKFFFRLMSPAAAQSSKNYGVKKLVSAGIFVCMYINIFVNCPLPILLKNNDKGALNE